MDQHRSPWEIVLGLEGGGRVDLYVIPRRVVHWSRCQEHEEMQVTSLIAVLSCVCVCVLFFCRRD